MIDISSILVASSSYYASKIPEFGSWIQKKMIEKDVFKSESRKYIERVIRNCGQMRIFGMSEPVAIENIYINVRLSNQISSRRRLKVDDRKRLISWEEDKTEGGLIGGRDLVDRYDRVLVLGRPGAGKTTLLKFLAMEIIKGNIAEGIPVYVSMKHWADSGLSLLDYVVGIFFECGLGYPGEFVSGLLASGSLIFLLDGYDEVYSVKDKAVREIHSLCAAGINCKFVLSCRISANDHVFESFTEVEVSEFDDDQIRAFIEKYFPSRADAQDCIRDLYKEENSAIRALAKTPLLLTLICISYSESMGLPLSRTELYREALEALLKKWDSSRSIKRDEPYKALTVYKKETLFGFIAYETFGRNEQFFEKPYVENMINAYMSNLIPDDYHNDPDVVLRSIESQHGLLVERAHRIYSFSHLTFQEYFVAHHIVRTKMGRGIHDIVKENIFSSRWSEVFSIVSSLLPDASEFVNCIGSLVRKVDIGKSARDSLIYLGRINYDNETPMPISRALALEYVLGRSVDHVHMSDAKTAFSLSESLSDLLKKLYRRYMGKGVAEASVLKLGLSENRKVLDEMAERLAEAYASGQVGGLSEYLYGNKILMSVMLSDCYVEKRIRNREIDQFLLGVK